MYALFNTTEDYIEKNNEISNILGYPNSRGTLNYAPLIPQRILTGQYAMFVSTHVEKYFKDCKMVESVILLNDLGMQYLEITDKEILKQWIKDNGMEEEIDMRLSLEAMQEAITDHIADVGKEV